MNKLEVGDTVKIKIDLDELLSYKYGYFQREGKVLSFYGNGNEYCWVHWSPYEEDVKSYSVDELELTVKNPSKPKKTKSDGGSSSYYDLPISDKLLKALNSRNEDGECYVKTEDLIDELFGNDFDFGTMFKSVVRGYLQTKGEGKAGNDLDYEMNKVVYYANKIKEKGCGD